MEQEQLKSLLDVLKMMKELELTLAEFYRTCKEIWLLDKDFWINMERSELKHAQDIELMIRILAERPEGFELGFPFKRPAIQTFIFGVKSNIQRLRNREIAKEKILFAARDIEESILESRYMEIIRTNEPEFQTLMKQIILDTVTHKDWLVEKMRQSNFQSP